MHSFLSFAWVLIVRLFVCYGGNAFAWVFIVCLFVCCGVIPMPGVWRTILMLSLKCYPPPSLCLRQDFSLLCDYTIWLGCLARKTQGSAPLPQDDKVIHGFFFDTTMGSHVDSCVSNTSALQLSLFSLVPQFLYEELLRFLPASKC